MLEYWNDGVMGFEKMEKWVIDKIDLDRVVKNSINNKIPLETNIPLFQHSIIPYMKQKTISHKLYYLQ